MMAPLYSMCGLEIRVGHNNLSLGLKDSMVLCPLLGTNYVE